MRWIYVAVGVGSIVLAVVAHVDRLGWWFAGLFGALICALGAWQLRAARPSRPNDKVQILERLPLDAQRAHLRRRISLSLFAFPALSACTGYQLWQLESGAVDSVSLWGPIGALYELVGFGPAVLAVPALGLLTITALIRKRRTLDATARALQPQPLAVSRCGGG